MQMLPIKLTAPKKRRRLGRKPLYLIIFFSLVAAAYAAIIISRPFAVLKPNKTSSMLSITTPTSSLPWPSYGQGAFGLVNGKIIASHGPQTPLPTASAAKVITALVVLDKHPLTSGAAGPSITLGPNDVALYNKYVGLHGSVLAITNGEQLTQRQMLDAMLLPSANNIADSLAIWAYGSVDAYLAAANSYLKQHDLNDSHVGGDASGFSPASTSNASDLVKIGGLAINNPVIKDVVGQQTAVVPGAGTVHNYNTLLGSRQIIGIKTGNNDQNMGVFIGAANATINGRTTTLITALTGAPNLGTVLYDSGALLAAARASFVTTPVVQKDTVLGTYLQPNGSLVQAVAGSNLSITVLRGNSVQATVKISDISYNAQAGQQVGSVTLPATDYSAAQSAPVILKQTPVKPSLMYRLLHP